MERDGHINHASKNLIAGYKNYLLHYVHSPNSQIVVQYGTIQEDTQRIYGQKSDK